MLEYYFRKGALVFKRGGTQAVWKKVRTGLRRNRQFQRYFAKIAISSEQLSGQIHLLPFKRPKISIIVPLYNTPRQFFLELIESIQAQTYPDWQLCFADGSDSNHSLIQECIQTEYGAEHRISYIRLAGNAGISGNTNAAMALATGDYIALMDHDDLLAPNALYEVACAIIEQKADFLYTDEMSFVEKSNQVTSIHFKPDFAIDTLRSNNYICHLTVFKRVLIEKTGLFNSMFDGSQDYDFILRLSEAAEKIVHIPKVLYYWRVHPESVANDISAKPYCIAAAKNAISAHLIRMGCPANVEDSLVASTYRIRYPIDMHQKISIVVPVNHLDKRVGNQLSSIINQTTYENLELVMVGNQGRISEMKIEDLLDRSITIQRVDWQEQWNSAAMCNKGAKHATGRYLVFLVSVIKAITPEWINEMLMFAMRRDVGAVGAMLYYPNNKIAHAGIGVGLNPLIYDYRFNQMRGDPGYMSRLSYAQDVSAVSGNCLMVEARKFADTGGFDATYSFVLSVVDFCLTLREKQLLNVFTPYAELKCNKIKKHYHNSMPDKEKASFEEARFREKWYQVLAKGDPYFSTHLSQTYDEFSTIL